jgi:hypothetical protein
MPLKNVARFERFFRLAAGLDVDKEDLRRYDEFVHRKVFDLLVRAEANAKANGRDVMEPWDLPITKGLQQCINDFKTIDAEVDLDSVLAALAAHPPMDREYSDELAARLPLVVGGIGVALARSFKVVEPELKNPQTRDWQRAFELFDLLL